MSAHPFHPGMGDAFIRQVLDQHLKAARDELQPTDAIRLVDPVALNLRFSEETNAERRTALQPLMALAEPKNLVMATPVHLAAIAKLATTMPNAAPFLNKVQSRLRAQILGRRPIQLGCQLLIGQPGNGKTYVTQCVGEALNLPVFTVSLAGSADTLALHGSSRQWHGCGPGRIVSSLARSQVANPIFILDEVDKGGRFVGHGSIQDALLDLLEPVNALRFDDKFLSVPVNASHCSFLCTANDSAALSEPLCSRLEEVQIAPPEAEQWVVLINVLYAAALREMGLAEVFRPRFPTWRVQDLLTGCASIRVLRRRIRSAIEAALMEIPDDQLGTASDLTPCLADLGTDQEAPPRRMGFL